jgi:dTDP-4-amino-4,6-dideoxy-D-galactose acyltransferase
MSRPSPASAAPGEPGTATPAELVPLPWDSALLGFPVARIGPPGLDDAGLGRALDEARRGGYRLIYWPAAPDRVAPDPLLAAFSGMLADRKATFVADDLQPRGPVASGPGCRVVEVPRGPASPRLIELGIAAGEYSRFRRDPGIPADKFRELYRTWVERSARGEMADAVLVAVPEGPGGEPVGMVTVELDAAEGEGRIGLIAVDGSARGMGLGRLLVTEAHRRMLSGGASRASVVTQLENAAACRLYEGCGYRLGSVQNVHHFWP